MPPTSSEGVAALNDIFYWSITLFAIIGVILNVKKDKRSFLIWMFTNGAFAVQTFIYGVYNMTFLFSVYFVLACWGVYTWR